MAYDDTSSGACKNCEGTDENWFPSQRAAYDAGRAEALAETEQTIASLRASLTRAEAEREEARALLGEAHWQARAYYDLSDDALGLNELVAPIKNSSPGMPDWLMDWDLMERVRKHLGGTPEALERYRPTVISRASADQTDGGDGQ